MVFTLLVNKIGGYYNFRQRYFKSKSSFKKKLFLFILKRFQHETNSYLPFSNIIEGPVNFLHGQYGIFISGSAKIGKNCTIYHQVTIGSNMLIDSKNMGSPTIGDNCLIGAGAKIIGKVSIGNNCRIGANAVVAKDVPENSVVYTGSQNIVSKKGQENKIYQQTKTGWGYQKDGAFVTETNNEIIKKLTLSLKNNKNSL